MSKGIESATRWLEKIFNHSFPNKKANKSSFIVDSENPLPSGVNCYAIEVLEDVTISTITDELLASNSGAYPSEFLAGFVSYGNFSELEVSGGKIKAYLA